MRVTSWLLICLVSASLAGCGQQAVEESAAARKPGPHIIPIDYEALYASENPPAYKPWPVYGVFLMSVAAQQTPLVMNPETPVPDTVQATTDIVFKEVDGEQIGVDVYQPKGDTSPNPLILIIHGGYWKAGDKSVHRQQGIEFAELGYTAAAMNYRLSAKHKFPAAIEDIRDSILHLIENAKTYNIDPTRIVTYGGSAGGHLSAFMGLAANTAGKPYVAGLDANAFKGIITLYGMHDLTLTIQREHPFTEQFIGKPYEEAQAIYRDASPIAHVDSSDPPVLLIHGSLDGSVSVKNSDMLVRSLEAAGVRHTYDRVEGWPHAMDFFSPIGERTLWFVHRFLREHMPSDELKAANR
ncbi:MAG: alpha/beta hydrolase [Planctomycetota bacterium]|nr:alpha/beta hydrolase [Planctomycetota bacterium]